MLRGLLSVGEALELMRPAVFRLEIEKNQRNGMWEWGTAFFVGERYALTAYHNLPSDNTSDRYALRGFYRGKPFHLTCSIAYSLFQSKGDIAVLELAGPKPEGAAGLQLGYIPRHTEWRERVRFLAGRPVCVFGFPFERDSQESKLVPGLIDSCQPLAERDWKEQHGESPGVAGLTEWLRIHTDENATQLNGISGAPILDRETRLVIGVQHSYVPKLKIVYGTELTPLAETWPSFERFVDPIDQHFLAAAHNDTTKVLRPGTPKSSLVRGLLPLPPRMLVGRGDVTDYLRSRLTSSQLCMGDSAQRVQVVLGVPGVGKTSLASALAHDLRLQTSFPDGVFWASLGQKPNISKVLEDWLQALTDDSLPQNPSITMLQARLIEILFSKRVLLIVDDVWESSDAEFLRVGGAHCVTLITTREPEVAFALAQGRENIYKLLGLSAEEAIELLIKLASWVIVEYPEEAYGLVEDFTGLPLAIHVAAQLLNSELAYGFGGLTVPGLLEEIRNGAALIRAKPPTDRGVLADETGVESVAVLLELSTNRLSKDERIRFALLGAMAPKPAVFEESLIRAVWDTPDSRPTIRKLMDRGLLERSRDAVKCPGEWFQMHHLLVLHARELAATLSTDLD